MILTSTKNTILLSLACSVMLSVNVSQAAELVQFSNGSIADANDVNANFDELATRIQNQSGLTGPAGSAGPAGATGPQGIQGVSGIQGIAGPSGATGSQGPAGASGASGPLSGLSCADGEVAVSSAGSWVCGDSENGALPSVGNITVRVNNTQDSSWQSWSGSGVSSTATVNVGGTVITSAANIDKVSLNGSFSFIDANSLRQLVRPDNFTLIGSKLGDWVDDISVANLGAFEARIVTAGARVNGFNQFGPGSPYALEPILLTRKSSVANNKAYLWWQDRASIISADALRFQIYSDTVRRTIYATYNFRKCVPFNWKVQADEEQISVQCSELDIEFANNSFAVVDWVNSVLTGSGSAYRDISVTTLQRDFSFLSSIPARYVLPVLGRGVTSKVVTHEFSFQPNNLRIEDSLGGSDLPQ